MFEGWFVSRYLPTDPVSGTGQENQYGGTETKGLRKLEYMPSETDVETNFRYNH